ncbi:MAG: EAL domain-containing protein [Ectothiorhodospiraceae bacterium]|nr:EAL domain-containing protein [Ectothiorhodospiraceae bacterium]
MNQQDKHQKISMSNAAPFEAAAVSRTAFLKQFRIFIILAWTIPSIFGLSFLLFIKMFTLEQVGQVMSAPIEPGFIVISLALAVWYFSRYMAPLGDYLGAKDQQQREKLAVMAVVRVQGFAQRFWGLFLLYLVIAPVTVIFSAERYSDFVAAPEDWFRINLVALTVSIIVGLPIFFRLYDLFGQALQPLRLDRPIVSIRTRVFLIAALVPLLVDTMLVQYYWTRTGYFTTETFIVWLALQVIALIGAQIFMSSFGRSLQPLEGMAGDASRKLAQKPNLLACSTDELGVLTGRYQSLLEHLYLQGQTLDVGNQVLRSVNSATTTGEAYDKLVEICCQALEADIAYLTLRDGKQGPLLAVSVTGAEYRSDGHFSLSLDEPSLLVHAFNEGRLFAVDDVENDPRVSSRIVKQYGLGSVIAAPLIAEGDVIGAIGASSKGRVRHFTQKDRDMMALLAREASAVVHAQSLQERRQQAELQYHQTRELAEVTLDAISDGVITTDENGDVVYLNPVAEEFTGWLLDEAEGRPLKQIMRLEDEFGAPLVDPVMLCREAGERLTLPNAVNLLHREGRKQFEIELRLSPIHETSTRSSGVVLTFHDTTDLNMLSHRLTYQASHDALTGLINRHEFEDRLELALTGCQDDGREHALCFLDIDQFKVVNNTSGHQAGDELLKQLGARFRATLREDDIVGRLGGDEFGLLLEDCPLAQAEEITDKILKMVRAFRFTWQDKVFNVSVSMGLVPINAASGSITDVLGAADSACYIAKDQGSNRVHVFERDDLALTRHKGEMQWLQQIREAMERDQFVLFHQRIEPLADDADTGFRYSEILLRLRRENGEIVTPNLFLPAAERYHLMPAVDRWVVSHALQLLGMQSAQLVSYSINLSAQSLCESSFLEFVLAELTKSGVEPDRVCFEITETAAIANLSRAMRFITELKNRGCRFALDDFGSGLSSFSYLKNLPVDYLKIDGIFVKDIDNNPIDRAMVEAINQIGHIMGIKTVAEYVTSASVMAELKAIGVDYGQGFHLAKPVPVLLDDDGVQASASSASLRFF